RGRQRIRSSEASLRTGGLLFFPYLGSVGGADNVRAARPDVGSRRPRRSPGSHAGREHVIGTLKAAFVQGRLAKDEFDLRVGQALPSRTYAELAPVTPDLPAGLTAAQPSKPARAPGERPILRRPGLVLTVATVLYAGMWPLAFVLPRNGEGDPVAGVSL